MTAGTQGLRPQEIQGRRPQENYGAGVVTHALGIDLGSTNVKVALVAEDGTVAAGAQESLHTERDGDRAEQDAQATWEAVVAAVRRAAGAAPEAAADVEAVGCCSQYSSLVPVDRQGHPTGPMVLYWDTRGTQPSWAIMERHPEATSVFVERHGIPPVGSGLSLGHLLCLQADRERHQATAAYLEPMDYLTARLTGRLSATQCTVFALQVCDNRQLGATTYDEELVRLAGVDATRLPPLLPVRGTVGAMLPTVATEMGIAEGAVVHAPMNDSQAGVLASGALESGVGGLAIGTTAVVVDTVPDMRVDLDSELVTMPTPFGNRYLVWAENGIAGKAVEHVLARILLTTDELGDHSCADPFADLDEVLASSGPGPSRELFLPWLVGSLAPAADRRARGGFLNVSLDTDRRSLVRSLVEGTAHNLAWLLPSVEAFSGQRMETLHFYGGAARSANWCQILSDVTGRAVRPLLNPDSALARAVALDALERSGYIASGQAAALSSSGGATHEPDPARHALYAEHQVVFEEAHRVLRPLYTRLNG